MKLNEPVLFVEINKNNFIFTVGKYDENQNFSIIETLAAPSNEILNGKIVNIDDAKLKVKKNIEDLENKLNCIFKTASIIIDDLNYSCINISGYKKLNGSQLLKENISYILNSLKLAVNENEGKKTILHIFNSGSALDGIKVNNLPIGMFGDFYNHELTFFLLENNDLKNVNTIFKENNLNISKILLKNYSEGVQIINKKNSDTFLRIKIGKEISSIFLFDQSSFKYGQNFNFGSNIILNDIIKICSVDKETIIKFLSDKIFKEKNLKDEDLLEKKYFLEKSYRKIRKRLILDIAKSRIEEIADIILNKNINLSFIKKKDLKVYLFFDEKLIADNFLNNFNDNFLKSTNSIPVLMRDFEVKETVQNAASLITFGWTKEAIPVAQVKNSLITRIFKSIFG